jgi:hypothetical protein
VPASLLRGLDVLVHVSASHSTVHSMPGSAPRSSSLFHILLLMMMTLLSVLQKQADAGCVQVL